MTLFDCFQTPLYISATFQPSFLVCHLSCTSSNFALFSSPYYLLRPAFNLIQLFSGTTAHFQASISTHNVHNYFLLFFFFAFSTPTTCFYLFSTAGNHFRTLLCDPTRIRTPFAIFETNRPPLTSYTYF